MVTLETYEKYICAQCGGSNIDFRGLIEWDIGNQRFYVRTVKLEDVSCCDCGERVKVLKKVDKRDERKHKDNASPYATVEGECSMVVRNNEGYWVKRTDALLLSNSMYLENKTIRPTNDGVWYGTN